MEGHSIHIARLQILMKSHGGIVPPMVPLRLLRWFCDPDLLEDVEGDLLELFAARSVSQSKRARLLLARDVLLLFRPGIIRTIRLTINRPIMLRNYVLVALRHARKYKGHTFLNLLSLVIGLASCMLILLWVQSEWNVDKFHEKSDRIIRVWRNMHQSGGEILTTRAVPQPFAVSLRNDYPEVDEVTLVGWDNEQLFRKDDLAYYETGKYVSPEFLRIFSFPLLVGDADLALQDISSIIITESLAEKYFGVHWRSVDILQQGLTVGDRQKEFQISGVIADPGDNSSIDFDWLISAQEYIQRNDWVNSWYNGGFRMCFTLREGADLAPLQDKVLQSINENTNYEADERIFLNKFSDNYLYSTFENGRPVGGRIQYIRILFMIAIFILVIACINFMNLATARSVRRSREVGVRKVLGAQRGSLRHQFFIESFVLSSLAVLLSLVVVWLVLPFFNHVTEKTLSLNFQDPMLWVGLIGVTLVSGALSGFYPALLLPSFKIISSLKGTAKPPRHGVRLREGLVVFQFALSILLIIGTLVVSQQMRFILNKDLGLDKDNIIFFGMSREVGSKMELYKNELLSIPGVQSVTATTGNPLDYGRSSGSAQWAGKDPDEVIEINVMSVDEDFVETMKMDMLSGRNFTAELSTDTSNYLINEVTAGIMGFDDPIDQDLSLWGQTGKVVGVVKNFHMSSMYEPISPLIIRYDPNSTYMLFVRIQGDLPNTLSSIETTTEELYPGHPFTYEFLDRDFASAYRSEMTINTVANIFAIISILISCLGLFGLSSYSAEQRSREIGIRKVYGASVTRIVGMLSWGYTKLILLAFLLAAPIAAYLMLNWLNTFEFRTDLKVTVFAAAGLVTLAIGALTVCLKSWQAAMMNPVQTLRDE